MLMCFMFYKYLEAAGKKKKKTSEVFLIIFTRMTEQRSFGKKNRHKFWSLPFSAMLFANRVMHVHLSVH